MRPTALIPVRIARTAKKRLAHVLGPDGRMELMQRLFDHVSGVLAEAGLDVIALTDEAGGLNGVVRRGLRRTGVPALVVHADLPLLAAPDVLELLDVPGDVVVARSSDGGTNGLLLRRRVIEPAFGVGSANAHAARARSAGLSARVVDIAGFAADIDDPSALTAFGASFLRPLP